MSKTLSYFLRHNPDEGGLEMDDQGFVELEELLEPLRENGWDLTAEALIERLDDPGVERFERVDTVVRATYGHSVDVEPEYEQITPDWPLYHGTSRRAWESIQDDGIKSMNRQYVHLSVTREEASRVGHRHDNEPVLLTVEPPENADGPFYRAGPVVLVEHVPPEWIRDHETA